MEIVKLWKYRSIEKVLWSFGLDKHLAFVLCEAFDERQGWVEIDKSTLAMKDDCKNQFKAMCILKYFYDSVKANQEPNPYIKINMKTDEARKALIELAENVYTVAAKEGQKDFVELGIKKVDSLLEKGAAIQSVVELTSMSIERGTQIPISWQAYLTDEI